MRIHSLEHEPFEGLANIEVWAKGKRHSITRTRLFKNEKLPQISEFDWLVIMGGYMSAFQEEKYPWLIQEKKFISEAITCKKPVLGICLGSQLIAEVLGGKVSRNRYREIGWHQVALTREAKNSPVFSVLPDRFTAFHWHGDTFEIPPGAIKIAESEACSNQAFEYGRVIGLQFHLEYSSRSIELMVKNCAGDLVEGKFIQERDEIISHIGNAKEMSKLLYLLLDTFEWKFCASC